MRQLLARLRAWKPPFRPPTKKQLVGGALAVGALLGGLIGLGPVVRQRVDKIAERYHLEVQVGAVRPALGGVRLDRVTVRARAAGESAPWLAIDLERVEVRVGWSLAPRSATVTGGKITIAGTREQVVQRIRDLRRSSASELASDGENRRGLEVSVNGVDVSWPGAIDAGSALEIDGLHFERAADAQESADLSGPAAGLVGFERARVLDGVASFTATGGEARFARKEGETIWTGGRIATLDAEVSLTPKTPAAAPTVVRTASNSPAVPRAAAPGVPGATRAGGDPATFGDMQRRAMLVYQQGGGVAAWAADHLAPGGIFEVSGLTLSLTQRDESLHVGPGRLALQPSRDGLGVSFSPAQDAQRDAASLSLRATLPRSGDLVAQVEGGPITLASLGVHEGNFGLVDVASAKLRAKMALALRDEGRRFTFDGDGQLTSLSIVHRALADDAVRGLDLGWSAAGVYELDGSLLRVDDLRLALGSIVVRGSGMVTQGADFVKVEARASVPPSDCQQMFASLPHALVPKLAGTRMAGTVSLRTGLTLDTRHPDDMDVQWDLRNQCRIVEVPAEIDVKRFAEPFRHMVYDERGSTVEITTGPGTPDWVPLHAMSPFLEAAITTTEDGGFRYHGGFDKGAIKNSIRDNLRAGRFLRGASTISMQLAKNLYLAREKNLSRKLQEAILTTYLEQSLSKDDILELYFNIVEFGPMIYGIGAAADHYFDTSSSDLSPAQALFLTSILPAPKRNYFAPTGQLSRGWQDYLHRLLRIMRARNKINDDELKDGLSEVVTYRVARSPRVRPLRDSGSDFGVTDWAAPDGP